MNFFTVGVQMLWSTTISEDSTDNFGYEVHSKSTAIFSFCKSLVKCLWWSGCFITLSLILNKNLRKTSWVLVNLYLQKINIISSVVESNFYQNNILQPSKFPLETFVTKFIVGKIPATNDISGGVLFSSLP